MLQSMGSQRVGHDSATELNGAYMVALFGKLVSCNWLSLGFGLLTQAASQVAEKVKCLLAVWETRVQSLGQEDPLEKKMAPHSSILV